MGRDAAAVIHDVGALLLLPASLVTATAGIAALVGDGHAVVPLLVVAAPLWAVGGGLAYALRHARAQHRWPAVEVVALGWLSVGLVAAGVFGLLGHLAPEGSADVAFQDPVNALFEGFSGITTTGMTMVLGQEDELTGTAQWWRSILQWVGGVGMVVFTLGIGHPSSGVRSLYEAEGRHPDLPGGVVGTVRLTALLYLGLTAGAVALMYVVEPDAWTAFNHGLTGISTGGFSVTGDSFESATAATRIVMLIVVIVGSMAFVALHVLLVRGDRRSWWRLTPVRAQAAVLVGGAGLLVVTASLSRTEVSIPDVMFQWANAASTAGFSSIPDIAVLGALPMALLLIIMFVGAPSGSTGGGLKLDRIVWLLKDVGRRLRRSEQMTWDAHPVPAGERSIVVRHAGILAALWLLTLAVGIAVLLALTDVAPAVALRDVLSAQSNIGFQSDAVGTAMPDAGKVTLVTLMYLGRLELLAALILATQTEHPDPSAD